jgi:hypothetical protein
MSFNDAGLLQATTHDIIMGLRAQQGAFADSVCHRLTRLALTGADLTVPTAQSLGQPRGKQAVGANIRDRNLETGSVTYAMGEFSSRINIPKATITALSEFLDPLSELAQALMQDVDRGIDAALATLLVNGTYNNAQSASNGVWSLSTSTPIKDLQDALNKTPGADTLILGQTSAQELARHPDLKEMSSNYSGAGAIPVSAMQSYLGEVLSIPSANVQVFGTFVNSANPGQTHALAYQAGDLAWIGHKNGLRAYEQGTPSVGDGVPTNGGYVAVRDGLNSWETAYIRTLDIVRGDKDLGCYITGL